LPSAEPKYDDAEDAKGLDQRSCQTEADAKLIESIFTNLNSVLERPKLGIPSTTKKIVVWKSPKTAQSKVIDIMVTTPTKKPAYLVNVG
jgi:hypothetical protein